MLDPHDQDHRLLSARLGRTRLWTFVSLVLERLTLNGWRIVTWCGFFGGLWLFRVPSYFGTSGSILTFLVFTLGSLFFIWRDLFRFRLPVLTDIDRRIESESAMRHRPLTAMNDSLANPQKSRTRMLWLEARERLHQMLAHIRAGKPQAFMASKDPYALRGGILLFFALGVYAAGPTWDERLMDGLMPLRFESASESPDRLSLWITPPQYTGLAPIVVKGRGDGGVLQIPQGSVVKITVRGGIGVPKLVAGENPPMPFSVTDKSDYILETTVPSGDHLKIKQGFFTRANWTYMVIPDEKPTIKVVGMAEIKQDGPMRFPIEVADDYGVKNLIMTATLNQSMNPQPLGEPINDTRVVMSPPRTNLPIQPVYDLTSHPWAGQPVTITFTVEDGSGQRTSSDPIPMVLPERPFMHPVAKALIGQRKRLILKPESDYPDIALKLETVMVRPGYYLDDKVVFLALRSAASRLIWADPPKRDDAKAVASLLWDTAIRVEGGEISIAARNLRDAQRNLEQALDNPDMSQEEIQELMSELRSAMAQYFMEMQREMQKRMAEGQQPMVPPEMLGRNIDPESLNNFLEQLEQKMKSGDKKGAQEMMAQLQRLMDMMDPSMAGPMPEDMQMMAEGINELQELIKRQKDLLSQTQSQMKSIDALKNMQRGFGEQLDDENGFPQDWDMGDMPPAPDAPAETPSIVFNTSPHKTEQEALRYILGKLMTEAGEKLGEVPENMGDAELEMRESSNALGDNDPFGSIPHQEQALEELEKAQQQLSEKLAQRMQQMTGISMSGGGMKFDPLGRPYGGDGNKNGLFGSPVKIPDEAERKRAQEILNMLRKRAGELDRPGEELDYYKRLLRQF